MWRTLIYYWTPIPAEKEIEIQEVIIKETIKKQTNEHSKIISRWTIKYGVIKQLKTPILR